MEEQIKDILYTLAAKMGKEQYTLREELKLKKDILSVFEFAKLHPDILYDMRIITFFNIAENGKLTIKHLKDAQNSILDYQKGKKSIFPKFSKKAAEIPTLVEEDLVEYCDKILTDIESSKIVLNSLKQLMEQNENGKDIFDVKNIEHFLIISMRRFDCEQTNLLMSLYQKWANEIEMEYKSLKKETFQTSGTLLTIKDFKSSNYPEPYDENIIENDIKKEASYIRSLLKEKEKQLADSLMKDNRDCILVRILYEIEMELLLLEKEENTSFEEIEVIEQLKEELFIEKEDIKRLLGGSKQWKKLK